MPRRVDGRTATLAEPEPARVQPPPAMRGTGRQRPFAGRSPTQRAAAMFDRARCAADDLGPSAAAEPASFADRRQRAGSRPLAERELGRSASSSQLDRTLRARSRRAPRARQRSRRASPSPRWRRDAGPIGLRGRARLPTFSTRPSLRSRSPRRRSAARSPPRSVRSASTTTTRRGRSGELDSLLPRPSASAVARRAASRRAPSRLLRPRAALDDERRGRARGRRGRRAGYSSLLEMKQPVRSPRESVRIDESPRPTMTRSSRWWSSPARRAPRRAASDGPPATRCRSRGRASPVRRRRGARGTGRRASPACRAVAGHGARADPGETERALREALATLQRMSGAA